MNARVPQSDLTFVVPTAFSPTNAPAYAPRPRNGLVARLAAVLQMVADAPRRRAALNELSALSDHELSDIGLSRSDLPRVFDPKFVQNHRAI